MSDGLLHKPGRNGTVCGRTLAESSLATSSSDVECQLCLVGGGRDERILQLEAHRPTLIAYMKLKLEAEDWRGVQDAASDLRDLDNELDGLRY